MPVLLIYKDINLIVFVVLFYREINIYEWGGAPPGDSDEGEGGDNGSVSRGLAVC
jgi:hypothetical protein